MFNSLFIILILSSSNSSENIIWIIKALWKINKKQKFSDEILPKIFDDDSKKYLYAIARKEKKLENL